MLSYFVGGGLNVVNTEATLKYVLAFLVIVSGFVSNLVLAAFKAYLDSLAVKEDQLAKREECKDKRLEDRFRDIESALSKNGIAIERKYH